MTGKPKPKRENEPYDFDSESQARYDGPPITGEPAPVSGIYQATDHIHVSDEGFFVRQGGLFPACPVCGQTMQFRLTRKIVHISEDPDFR